MKSVTEILGGSQILLDISYDIQDVFEDYLTDYHRVFLAMLRVIEDGLPHIEENRALTGRKAYTLLPFIRAFLAKSFFKLTTNKDLILRLKSDSSLRNICGFSKIPSKASFSRRFEVIACLNLMGRGINTMAEEYHKGHIIGHVSRDSTVIAAREKPISKKKDVKEVEKPKRKRGRPKKGEERPPEKEVRLEKQLRQSAGKALKEIKRACAWGGKKNSKGKAHFWSGYKLHLDVSDLGIPLTAVVTGANVHDSQVAIPMEKLTERKVTYLYSLMDAAYDALQIRSYIRGKGRYKIRSTVERTNSHLKDWFIPDKLYLKGYRKINCVLMTAVLCLSAVKILQYFHLPEMESAA